MKSMILIGAAFLAVAVEAAATLPHVFGDNMVLQRRQKVPVWGKAEPGEKVTVSFAGQSVSATADATGRWKLSLAPLESSAEGRDFIVTSQIPNRTIQQSDNQTVFSQVLVGEVWFCSGQSNMEFPMGGLPWDAKRRIKDSAREIAAANYPLLRHFKVPRTLADKPCDDVKGAWQPTTPQTVTNKSAVAYVFGETLLRELNVPVGLIECSWGGTRIEPWTPAAHPDDIWFLQHLRPKQKQSDVPTVLWNGMVAGLVPYAIRGAIWYQGCANRADGDGYLGRAVTMVRGWRREWGQGDFPFFLVQLAPFKYDNPKGTVLPVFQRMQSRIPEKIANCGYTVINDVGNVNDIHPTDKRTVGMRLADQVLDRVYGKFVRPWKTPIATGAKSEGGTVRVNFAEAEGLKTRDGLAPTEFELCDEAGKWLPASASIDRCDVVLTLDSQRSAHNPRPATFIGVRFAPYNASTPNLVNGAGLPAGPFLIDFPDARNKTKPSKKKEKK